MELLIKQVKVVDAGSPHNGQVVDIYIQNNTITEVGSSIEKDGVETWQMDGNSVSVGWVDVGTYINDPGFEYKEDFQTAAKAAEKGGFTNVLCASNTHPAIQSKSEVLYVINNTREELVNFRPLGAFTKGCEGKEIAEMYDMYTSGAVGFSDGHHALQHSGVMLRGLMYVKAFDGWVCNQPLDESIASGGYAHEGFQSTLVGMKGIPDFAETMMVRRDLYLLEYTESKLHLSNISTKESVELIREAKAKGLQVTASVNPMNLYFTDEVLNDFDTNYKVSPPIRSAEHRDALLEGLKDGTIDCIVSNHRPQDTESKRLEFMYADDGVIMLETAFAIANMATENHLTEAELVAKFTTKQREMFRLPTMTIEAGQPADLTIFNKNTEWAYHRTDIQSKSKNSPFQDKYLKGKVLGVVNKGQSKKFED
ncbi:MAG: dihydroorotase [Saprospiraceae bacterium]